MDRVQATPAAIALIERLIAEHGPLMFHVSGGCCDGSSPMCYPRGELRLGERDVRLGEVAGCEVHVGGEQWQRWQHTSLVLDVVAGRGASFSLEAPTGQRFLLRSEICAV